MKYFIDLGVYDGDTIVKAMKHLDDIDFFIGFEPIYKLYKIAKKRLIKFNNVKIYNKAVSTVNEKVKFYYSNDKKSKYNFSKGSTLLEFKKTGNIRKDKFKMVDAIDFSEFLCNNFNSNDIIILKIDIEGEEYFLLNHLIKTKSIKLIKKIYCEWHNIKIPELEKYHNDIINELKKLNFNLTGNNFLDEFNCIMDRKK
jgi:FkbM family methyltransferase